MWFYDSFSISIEYRETTRYVSRWQIISAECGGIINIDYTSANPEVFYVEYKLDTLYENNEFCVWTINSTVDSWEQLQVTLIEDGFEQGADGLDAYTLYFDSSASSTLSQCSL